MHFFQIKFSVLFKNEFETINWPVLLQLKMNQKSHSSNQQLSLNPNNSIDLFQAF
jgi:hypothetical protein